MADQRFGRPTSAVKRGQSAAPPRVGVQLVIVAIAALVASCAGPAPTAAPSASPLPSVAAASPVPSMTPTASTSPGPQTWARLTLDRNTPVADLEPLQAGGGGVALDSAFKLTSLDGRSPRELATRLVAEPSITFKVVSTDGSSAIIRPSAPMQARTLYKIALTRQNGTAEALWAAQTAGPLNVVETIPGDEATGVPVDSGIEITFDQPGVSPADLANHFQISPATKGRFEAAGRTIAFVPATPLAKGRVYTVTVTRGLPLAGTGQVLPTAVVFRFETAASRTSTIAMNFAHPFVEASPRERAAMSVYVDVPDDAKPPTTVPVTVHRLPTMSAAIDALGKIDAAPSWAMASTATPVSLTGLPRVASATVKLNNGDQYLAWIQLPDRLAVGWYLVTETWNGIPRQTVLQVTNISTFTMLTNTRSAVWVNDLATGEPLGGATVTLGGRSLGATDDRGLLVAKTPTVTAEGDSPPTDSMIVIRDGSRSAFQPVFVTRYCPSCALSSSNDRWWNMFTSDRSQYRSTDSVNAWGVLRDRDSGRAPTSVSVTMVPDASFDAASPPIATATAVPDASGAFALNLAFTDVPVGEYRLMLRVGREAVGELWLQVATIVKPAYRLSLSTDRHAVISGQLVTANVDAAFFEGTPVAGTELSLFTDTTEGTKTATTDALGHASAAVRVVSNEDEQWTIAAVQAIPTLPEEAEIGTMSDVAVFRGSALVDAEALLSGSRLTVTGKVSDVAFGRFEAPGTGALWNVDPRGAGRANATVKVRIVQITNVRKQIGTHYDFITKRVVPTYDYSERTSEVGTITVRTGTNGTFRLVRTVSGGDSSYRVLATYVDEGQRSLTAEAWAETPVRHEATGAWLEAADPSQQATTYSVGDPVRVRFMGGISDPTVSRYLYTVTQRGLQYATVGTTPTFRTTFTAASVPDIGISAVRFNGYGYDLAILGWQASLQRSDRQLTVAVSSDKPRYAPGETATVSVRTVGPDGRPVAASVFVTVIDEKLYAMGAAEQSDPLDELYREVDSGIVGWAASHRTPADDEGDGKGDTTGGGDGGRSDFRDWLVAKLVRTGTDGRASLRVPLSDDLTSWHVSASAIDRALDAGTGTGTLPVGLPLFVEATIASEYVAADRPVIRVRGFGSQLSSADTVTFTISSDTLPMTGVTVRAKAFQAAEVALPALSIGSHRIRIAASVGSGSAARTDVLVRTFRVVQTRASSLQSSWAPLDAATGVRTGSGLTRVTLVDAGRGRVVPTLDELAWTSGGRSDVVLAARLANRVLVDEFGLAALARDGDVALDPYTGLEEGLPIVPYGSMDLDVTALAAMTRDPGLDAAHLASALDNVWQDQSASRDRRLLALAGLAALGEPVLADIRGATGASKLTVAEKIDIALGALALGDEALARSIEQELLTSYGRRLGPWVRLDVSGPDDASLLTARLAIVAASLGEPVAADMDAWLAENAPRTTTVALERALAARGWAQRVAGASAVAAVTVGGERRQITIDPAEPVTVQLTPAQAATARVEPVSGQVLIVTTWDGEVSAASLTPASGQRLERTVTPGTTIGLADTVIVNLRVTLGPDARGECWRVVDLVPSGLAPISVRGIWDSEDQPWTGTSPDVVDGQRVEFCVTRDPKQPVQVLRYVARVVDPGTYAWEPAVMQSTVVPNQGIVIAPTSITIRGSSGT